MSSYRILVTGGRNFSDRKSLYDNLDLLHRGMSFECVIEGGALGADRLAREWAQDHNVFVMTFEADWSIGKAAGPQRNYRMIKEGKPHFVVAFPGGAGTEDMVRQAKKAGIGVIRFE